MRDIFSKLEKSFNKSTLINDNLLSEQARKSSGLEYSYSKNAMKWRWDGIKLSIKGEEVPDLIDFMGYLNFGEFQRLRVIMKNDTEEVKRVMEVISGRVKKKKVGKLLEEIFQDTPPVTNNHDPKGSPKQQDPELSEDARVAGEDYPSHVIDSDGFHIFTWKGLVYALHPTHATPECVAEVKGSSFEKFKMNVLNQRKAAETVEVPEPEESSSLAEEFSKATENLMNDEDKMFGRVPKQARHKRRR